ncbi:DUF5822 domain-containing protein [Halorussus gelatinilyticus]|uniref:DUF5822 domain-containing protein n=1 Tax=Halorussus gelatinilyticus TaxID=2937524 RepID=A0A8U0IIG7_9EURY|nr:DUF5822 domain-containing protein [Halorussus gelatinilyticus]UPW00588.1 DUF5822 domain-containing protein [Halorussus gelatinilyticus]
MPEPVETHDPEGVDYGWVMQTTFVVTIVVGAPVVALIAWLVGVSLPTWAARAEFAIRVGAVVWFVVAVGVFLYARRTEDDSAAENASSKSEN